MSGTNASNDYQFFQHISAEILAIYVGAVAAVFSLLTVLGKIILRPRVVVNCWFCNTNSRVASEESNSWYCSQCEQYNGFLANGDYNKDIPEQRYNPAKEGISFANKSKTLSDSNGLCDKCNANQEMKIRHLARFQPAVPCNYDEELNIYRNQLDNAYRLCPKCEHVVSETLEKKKTLVLGMQLQESEKRILGRKNYFKNSQLTLSNILTFIVATLSLMTTFTTPLLKSMGFPLLNVLQEQVESNYWTIVSTSFSAQLALTMFTTRKLPLVVCGAHLCLFFLEDQWGPVEELSYASRFLSGLTLLLTLCSKKTRKSAFVRGTKIDRTSEKLRRSVTPELQPTATNLTEVEEKPYPVFNLAKPMTTDPLNQDDNSSVDSAFSNHDSCIQESDIVKGDVNSLIQSLNDWNSKVEQRPRTPNSRHEFQSRQYGRDKPLLNPPKLTPTPPKNINESSWVAGGFWQNHLNHPNEPEQLSRPGSPNSSFYSQASSSWRSSTPGPTVSPATNSFEAMRPGTPTHFPMYMPTPSYGPPNGFQQQPYGFQPFVYPMWNPAMFQPITTSPTSTASCSSASTCGSVLRRKSDINEVSSWTKSIGNAREKSSFFEVLRRNSSVILYTSAFYVTVTATLFFVLK